MTVVWAAAALRTPCVLTCDWEKGRGPNLFSLLFQLLCFQPPERKRFYQNVSISQGEGECRGGLVLMQGVFTTRQWHACSPCCASGLFVTSMLCPFVICSKTTWWESFQHHLGEGQCQNADDGWKLADSMPLSAPALSLFPLWGSLLFLSACSFLIPQDFYSDSPGGFEINLDHRKLKTPQAKLFTVPSEALAIAVATEWDSQKDTIKFYTMHLVSTAGQSVEAQKWSPEAEHRESRLS